MRRADLRDGAVYIQYSISIVLLFLTLPLTTFGGDNMAFPGAMGWGGETKGAWGHPTIEPVILKVTSLSGGTEEGTLRWALTRNYPRIVVFEVGGVIDLEDGWITVTNPYLTIAGQTAPSPGITTINGYIYLDNGIHDVMIQHISMRTGEHATDPENNLRYNLVISLGANNILVDHCSFTWSTFANIGITAPDNPPHNITVSNCIIAEGIESTWLKPGNPPYPAPSQGMFMNRNLYNITVLRNLFAWNDMRNPIGDGSEIVYVNNFIRGYSHDALLVGSWPGNKWSIVGNYAIARENSTRPHLVHVGGTTEEPTIYFEDNQVFLSDGETPDDLYGGGVDRIIFSQEKHPWHDNIIQIHSEDVPSYISVNVGARPWDRDSIDQRIIDDVVYGTGSVKTSETWGPHPDHEPTYREFDPDEWYLDAEHPGVEPKKWPI